MSCRAPLLVAIFLMLCSGVSGAEPKARTFAGHTGPIHAIAVTTDGKFVASAGSDGAVKVWDMTRGKDLFQLGAASSGWSVSFSADGKKLAIAGMDQTVRVFDALTGKELRSFAGHTGTVWSASLAPDGKRVASASEDGTVRIWDVEKGKEERQLKGPSGAWPIAFSPDGSLLAVGFSGGAVQTWDTKTWKMRPESTVGGGVWPIAVSPDSRTVAAMQWQNATVQLWETATGQLRDSFEGAGGGGWVVAFVGSTAIGVGPGGVTLWDLWSGQKAAIKTTVVLASVACSADGRTLAAGDANGTIHVWDIRELRKELRMKETRLAPQEIADHWAILAEGQADQASRSIRALIASPGQAVPALRERLKPVKVPALDEAAVVRLIAQLDDDDFEVREKASQTLEKLGPGVAPLLRTLVSKTKSAEARRRLATLLERWEKLPMTAEDLRAIRAVEVLEAVGSAEARQLLKTLAEGADSVPTREAKAALGRMK